MAQEYAAPELSREEAVYHSYAPKVFAYLLRRLPSYQDAEDLLLDVFLVVLEKLPTLAEDERRLSTYLHSVARNKMVDYYRKRGNHQILSLEEIEEDVYEREELAPEQFALAHERYSHLQQAISTLPVLQQTILRLRYSHGLRCGEIAALLNKNDGAVRVMLSRSLKALRSLNSAYEER